MWVVCTVSQFDMSTVLSNHHNTQQWTGVATSLIMMILVCYLLTIVLFSVLILHQSQQIVKTLPQQLRTWTTFASKQKKRR